VDYIVTGCRDRYFLKQFQGERIIRCYFLLPGKSKYQVLARAGVDIVFIAGNKANN
jgi:hypothetical protein